MLEIIINSLTLVARSYVLLLALSVHYNMVL